MGSSKGVGKSWWVLLDAAKYFDIPNRHSFIFRRTFSELSKPGGMWSESTKIYPHMGAVPTESKLLWEFPSGATVSMHHCQHPKDARAWNGIALGDVYIDEANEWEEQMMWDLFSCQRATADGPAPVMGLTCNPKPGSYLLKFTEPYLDEDGYCDPQMSGKIRWFDRVGDKVVTGDTREEVLAQGGDDPVTYCFIGGNVWDNKELVSKRPEYVANLKKLPMAERMRYLGEGKRGGNWFYSAQSGDYFQAPWFKRWDPSDFEIARVIPQERDVCEWVLASDLAATPVQGSLVIGYKGDERQVSGASRDPDWTCFVKLGRFRNGDVLIRDVWLYRDSGPAVEWERQRIARTSQRNTTVVLVQDPGQAGKDQYERTAKEYRNLGKRVEHVSRAPNPEKIATEASKLCAEGRVWCHPDVFRVREFWTQLEGFPEDGVHDDAVSALSYGVQYCLSRPVYGSGGLSLGSADMPRRGTARNDTMGVRGVNASKFHRSGW